jgi:SAM-dependent methyltransferase
MSPCPICRISSTRVLGPHPDFSGHNIVRCRECTMISIDPQPSFDELAELYPETYRKNVQEQPSADYFAFMDKRAAAQRAFISSHFRVDRESKVLDIGCAAGSLLAAFAADTPNLEGYEPDILMAAAARDRLPASARIHNELCDPATLPSETYDLITLSHIFEHVLDPVGFLRHLLRVIRPEGLVFIEVPNESVSEVMRQVRAAYRGKLHLSYFNPTSLGHCAARSGGRAMRISTFGPSSRRYSLVPPEMLRRGGGSLLTRAADRVRRTLPHPFRPKWVGNVDLAAYLAKEDSASGVWIRALFSRTPINRNGGQNLGVNHEHKNTI